MTERKQNPKKMQCTDWEMRLVDALDGLLTPAEVTAYELHRATCAECASLYEEARRGREWLGFLSASPPVPAGLLERLLSETGPSAQSLGLNPALAAGIPFLRAPNLMTRTLQFIGSYIEPRILLTAAMAFFSITLTLNLAGLRLDRVHLGWLRPNIVRSYMERHITAASTPIVRIYDHVRESYEVDSKVREIEKTTQRIAAPLKQVAPALNGEEPSQQEKPTKPNGGAELHQPAGPGAARPNETRHELPLLEGMLIAPESPALNTMRERN